MHNAVGVDRVKAAWSEQAVALLQVHDYSSHSFSTPASTLDRATKHWGTRGTTMMLWCARSGLHGITVLDPSSTGRCIRVITCAKIPYLDLGQRLRNRQHIKNSS